MSLRTRLTLIGVVVLAGALAVVAVLAYELSRVQGRAAVDDALRDDLRDLRTGLPALIAEQAGSELTDEQVQLAVTRYLATHPASAGRVTVIELAGQRLVASGADGDLVEAVGSRASTDGLGQLRTLRTPAGVVRVASTPLRGFEGHTVGRAVVAGSLEDVLADARDALRRVLLAGVAALAVGAVAFGLATGRSLAPVRRLAEVARRTAAREAGVRAAVGRRRDEVAVVAEELNRMLDRIEADEARRSALLAALSHELRTPVAVAEGHLELFEQLGPEGGQSTDQLVGVLRRELRRLGRLVDDLSMVARGSLADDVRREPVFVPDLLHELTERLDGLGLPDVQIVEDGPPVVVEGDADRIAQCVLNLVRNAAEHTPAGTTISLDARIDDGRVELVVADDGPGLAPEVAGAPFEPFVSTRPESSGPSGLGLAIVRSLTEAQGGAVTLETGSTGTKVTLRFPVASGDGG